MMADYIQSNDDSSNLALYAGIGLFAGGAALAYRMSRDPSKGDTAVGTGTKGGNGKNGLVMKYDGEKPASAWRGGAKALFGGQWGKGMAEFAQSAIDKSVATTLATGLETSTAPKSAGKRELLQEIGNSGSKSAREADLKRAMDTIFNSGKSKKGNPLKGVNEAYEEMLMESPYSPVTPEDIQRKYDREKKSFDEVRGRGASVDQANRARSAPDIDSDWATAMDNHKNGVHVAQELPDDWAKAMEEHERTRPGREFYEKQATADRLAKEEKMAQARTLARTRNGRNPQHETEADRNRATMSFEEQEAARARNAKAAPVDPIAQARKETKELLNLNPTMDATHLNKQVPGAANLDPGIIDTQRVRGMQQQQTSVPTRQERNKQFKTGIKNARAELAKGLKDKNPEMTTKYENLAKGIEYPKGVTKAPAKKALRDKYVDRKLVQEVSRRGGDAPVSRFATDNNPLQRGTGKYAGRKDNTTPKRHRKMARKAAIISKMLG